jgi:hypothetical protein|tara:strand:- start:329 stop:1009 length:681 start_codon:yes stop_codon:yes gene_type:complete
MSIKLKGSTDGSVTLQAPADTSPTGTDKTLILPADVGSANQFLQNGSTAGTLEFGALVSSDMPTGSILQVKGTYLDTTSSQSISASTRAEISGLSVSITPTTLTSNMLVFVRWNGEYNDANNYDVVFGLKRDSSNLGHQSSAGNRSVGMQITAQGFWASDANTTCDTANYFYLDEENRTSSGQITYKATYQHGVAGILYNQRTVNDGNDSSKERPTSSIVVMEVAA